MRRFTYSSLVCILLTALLSKEAVATQYAFAPSSRHILPIDVYRTTGNVSVTSGTLRDASPQHIFLLSGPGASITYDFGKMVAGVPTLLISNPVCKGAACTASAKLPGFTCGSKCQGLGLAYSESKRYVGESSDLSTLPTHDDGTLYLPLKKGEYTVPSNWGRGAFRYLTLSLDNTTASTTHVGVQFSSLYYTAAPRRPGNSLKTYTGHFSSSDDVLNQIWEAGAYTLQLCTTAANSSVDHIYAVSPTGWSNGAHARKLNATQEFLADGAKRDRNPWAGDVAISMKSAYVTQNFDNLVAVRNTLQEVIILQDTHKHAPTYGYFPYAGSPLGDLLIKYGAAINLPAYSSDTYHLWAIAEYAEYIIRTQDYAWGKEYWTQILVAISATYKFLDSSTGLFNGTRTHDWGRIGQGGQNIALNALYFHTLNVLTQVSSHLPSNTLCNPQKWQSIATKVKQSANRLLYDPSNHLYFDNTTSAGHKIHPQDGNSLAIVFNLTSSVGQQTAIAKALSQRWNRYGAPAPELPGSISPFISSFELTSHFEVNAAQASSATALELVRRSWGYITSAFSNSTLIEGYGSNGALQYGFYGDADAFISHVHAWSTGPTYSLLYYVVGIRAGPADVPDAKDGSWVFKPAPRGAKLSSVNGGFKLPTSSKAYEAGWNCSARIFSAQIETPADKVGTIYVPTFGVQSEDLELSVDGKKVKINDSSSSQGAYFRIGSIKGGQHSLKLQSRGSKSLC